MSFFKVSADDVLNTPNNETAFSELRIFLKEYFEIKFQDGCVLKYQNFRICKYPLGFSVDQTDQIMELVNEWFQFIKVDTPFRKDSTYEEALMAFH